MSEAIQEALARRASLQEQIDLIDTFIELHGRIFGESKAQATDYARKIEPHEAAGEAEASDRGTNDVSAILGHIEGILGEAAGPQTRGQIKRSLEEQGVIIHSKDVSKYLGTLMWRNPDRFVSLEGLGYWLKSRPLPPWIKGGRDELFE